MKRRARFLAIIASGAWLVAACGLLDDPSAGLVSGRGDDPALHVTVDGGVTTVVPDEATERWRPDEAQIVTTDAIRLGLGDVYDIGGVLDYDVRGATIALRVRVVPTGEPAGETADMLPVLVAILYDPLSATRYFAVLRPGPHWETNEYVVERVEAVYGTADYARYSRTIALEAWEFATEPPELGSWKWIAVAIDRNGVGAAYAEGLKTVSEMIPDLPETRRSFGNIAIFPFDGFHSYVESWEWNSDAIGFDPIDNPPQDPSSSQFLFEVAEIRVFAYALSESQLESLVSPAD